MLSHVGPLVFAVSAIPCLFNSMAPLRFIHLFNHNYLHPHQQYKLCTWLDGMVYTINYGTPRERGKYLFSGGPRRRRHVSKGPQLFFSFFFFFFFSGPLSDWSRQTLVYSHWSTQTECITHSCSKQPRMKLCGSLHCAHVPLVSPRCTNEALSIVGNPLNTWT